MTNKTTISAEISATDPDAKLGLEVWIDNVIIKDFLPLAQPELFQFEVDDTDGNHTLKFVLKNKLPEHTTLDIDGKIVNDALITISNIKFDDVTVDLLFSQLANYKHNFNGTAHAVEEKFFGSLGCNGTVTFEFSTPFYLWLLENM